MTEEEWLASDDPSVMLEVGDLNTFVRKLRLFATACCFEILDSADDPREMQAVIVAEKLADGLITEEERAIAEAQLMDIRDEWVDKYGGGDWHLMGTIPLEILAPKYVALDASHCAQSMARYATYKSEGFDGLEREMQHEQADLIRDIFGNPFRPVTFDPRWRTTDVLGVARAIYEDRAFERMPILADALMDAGCADEQIIEHCRGTGPHVRGCWVVDLVLGKE